MQLIRSLITLALIGGFVVCGATVPLGDRTLFGHIQKIWQSEEAQGLVDGVKEKSGPVFERIKRGVEAATEDPEDDQGE